MTSRKLNLVVAACNNSGIGVNGTLPWRIRGDMAFFKRITSQTKETDKQNGVIMGRKTWDSIPEKFRPLKDRINVIISRTLQKAPQGAYIAGSLEEAVDILTSGELASKTEGLFVIGGSSIYKMALLSPDCHRVYLTRVLADYDCDTYLPEFDTDKEFKLVQDPNVDSTLQTEGPHKYQFEVYEKIKPSRLQAAAPLRPFNIAAAMLNNRGIGKNGTIAWAPIKKDYEYYTRITGETKDPDKKCVNIKGRVTWEETGLPEKSNPKRINIVISRTWSEPPDEYVHYLAHDFEHALRIASTSPVSEQTESIWVLGGEQTFREAMRSPYCHKIHMTRIYADYDSDRFCPPFEKAFQLIRDPSVPDEVFEENGVEFKFEVYERIK